MDTKPLKLKSRLLGLALTLLAGVATLVAAEPAAKPTAPDVKIDFTDKGELSITLDGQVISQPTKSLDPTVRFRDPEAKLSIWGADDKTYPVDKADLKLQSTSYDAAKRQLTQTFAWGEVVRTYQVVPEGVNIEVTVRNTSPKTLAQFDQRLFTLKMPGNTGPATTTEAVFFGQAAPAAKGDTLSGPVALPLVGQAGYSDGRGKDSRAVVATTPETKRQLKLSWETDTWVEPWNRKDAAKKKLTGYAVNDPVAMDLALRQLEEERAEKGETWWLTLSVGGDRLLYHDRYASRPIAPGGSDTYTVWLRFGNASDPLAPAKEALQGYAKAHPMLFKWDDRRPIVATMIGDKFPFHEPEGLELKKPAVGPRAEEIRKLMLDHADRLIAQMKKINAQGMIVWNIEGDVPPYLKYAGDPHMVESMCPEADAVADEFFKKFRDAGFKVGVCLRPSVIAVKEEKDAAFSDQQNLKSKFSYFHDYPHPKRPPADILSEKVEYAKKRWGCNLFYVDTNDGAGFWPKTDEEKAAWPKNADGTPKWYHALLNEDVWAEVLRRHPDVLFTIEHTPLIQYTVNAPFDGLSGPLDGTPPVVKATWPDAFKCLTTIGGGALKDFWRWVEQARNGDIILCGGGEEFIERAVAVSTMLQAGPPKELDGMTPEQLLAVALDPAAAEPMRFFAAKQVCEGKPDAASIDKLLAAKGNLVPMLALDSLTTPESVAAHVGQFTRLPKYVPQYGPWTAPVSGAMRRGGPAAVSALVEHIKKTPADARVGIDILFDTPGKNADEALLAIMNDATLPDEQRFQAAGLLGWRTNAGVPAKDAVLAYLLPLLNDAKMRRGAATALHPRYVYQHGLWWKEPRVLEAAKAALAAEQAQPEPDKAFIAVLEKIVKGQP
ncbi:MAG: hypothetical protein K8R57_04600 [Verrucomicrobia bacterium]|nr:hypothetical protein [Verrucomicrobiota bacterium]